MAVHGAEYPGLGNEGAQPSFFVVSETSTPNSDRKSRLRKLSTAASDATANVIDAVGSTYLKYIKSYHRLIPNPTARLVINAASGPILGLAIVSGVVALAQANGADQPKPKIERITTTPPGPKSVDDCEAFSAGDPMFEMCMQNRELRKQTMTP